MRILIATLAAALLLGACGGQQQTPTLLNVSYDPTREFYADFNEAFVAYYKQTKGQDVRVTMSHDGSAKQARKVIEGQAADVVTLALAPDIDAIARTGRLPLDWQTRLPLRSSPYTSTIVFLVRQGNPHNIRDWSDLARPDVHVAQPDPRTSGGARYNYLAMWAWAQRAFNGDEAQIRQYVGTVYRNAPKLDAGGRGASLTFAENKLGEVLLGWENDAMFLMGAYPNEHFELVYPSMSILAEPPVALVDQNVDRRGTRALAEEYLRFLYSRDGQRIAAKHFFRPAYPDLADPADVARFKDIERISIDEVFGGWTRAQATHFEAGGTFDQIYAPAAQR
jgi:sulfate/thiosulfate-binding protein